MLFLCRSPKKHNHNVEEAGDRIFSAKCVEILLYIEYRNIKIIIDNRKKGLYVRIKYPGVLTSL
jgi:hypothetical protein